MQNHIISVLKNSSEYVSGEALSKQLKITRAAVWKNIEELRKEGYKISAVSHHGYRLVSSPDRLYPAEISANLKTKIIGKRVEYFDSTDSTMDAAFKLGLDGAQEGTVVLAEAQTKGRGRFGRHWVSPKGKGIYVSIILRPKMSTIDVPKMTLLSGVVVCEAIANVAGLQASLKWPNDVLISNKKAAGILTELNADMDRVRFVVIGIGMNVNTDKKNIPSFATSLKYEGKKKISRVELLQELFSSLEKWYAVCQAEGFDKVLKRWKELSSTLGQRVKIVDQSGTVEGKAIDLDRFGGLMVKNEQGVVVTRMSGDVVHI